MQVDRKMRYVRNDTLVSDVMERREGWGYTVSTREKRGLVTTFVAGEILSYSFLTLLFTER